MGIVVLYARPDEFLVGTPSLTAGTAVAGYPVTNVADGRADLPLKTTGLTATVRQTVGSSTVKAVAVAGHNRPGTSWVLTSGAGAMGNLTVPAHPEDGLPLTPWRDLRTEANTTSTTFDVAVPTGTGNVYLGELVWVTNLRVMRSVWGVQHPEAHLAEERRTAYGVRLIEDLGVRVRRYVARVSHPGERAAMLSLARACKGIVRPFLLIPNEAENNAMLVQFVDPEITITLDNPAMTVVNVEVMECSQGVIVS